MASKIIESLRSKSFSALWSWSLTIAHKARPLSQCSAWRCFEEAKSLSAELSSKTGITNIPITNLPPAILVHGGPGVLGVSFFVN